jgi:hypothetical protein
MMVIENNNIRKSNNDGSRIGNDVDLSIYYKYLKGLSTDEVIGIFDTVGVAIDCKYCGYIYVDKGKKTLHTYDFSVHVLDVKVSSHYQSRHVYVLKLIAMLILMMI